MKRKSVSRSQPRSASRELPEQVRRKIFEEERLYGEIRDAIEDRMEEQDIRGKALAAAAGLSEGRISQILSGDKNLTLKTLAGIGVALGARFVAELQALDSDEDRHGVPLAPRFTHKLQPSTRALDVHALPEESLGDLPSLELGASPYLPSEFTEVSFKVGEPRARLDQGILQTVSEELQRPMKRQPEILVRTES